MSDLLERIRIAQRDAAERVVMDDLRRKGLSNFPFTPCICPTTHCRGEPNYGQFCKKAQA